MENYQKILFDRSIYELGLLPQRSIFTTYSTPGGAPQGELLSGVWRGAFSETVTPELLARLSPDAVIDDLPAVTVPMPLELQGWGQVQYVNVQYPFDGHNDGPIGGEIGPCNPCMLYLRDYKLDKKRPGKRYTLNFKGSESALFLYINGAFVGYSENLFLDSEFDVTPYLHAGANRIGALTFRYCSSSWLLDQDFFRFSGLTRDVVLTETDALGVFDIEIRSDVNSAARTSRTAITLTGKTALRELCVTNASGETVWQCRTEEKDVTVDFSDLHLWSAEMPYLYTLTVTTFRDGEAAEIARLPFGFREVKIAGGILRLNGQRLIFNGANRHEWNMHTGRTVTHADMAFDAQFMKEHNINAVRTSHYPNHSDFYTLCDEAGIYMIDEACLESHGTQYRIGPGEPPAHIPGSDESWATICVSKLLRMYERDKNHPAIMLWSLGNESGVGTVFARMREALLRRAPGALIHYEQCTAYPDQRFLSDVYSTMYTGVNGIAGFIEDGHDDKPYILCEYAHCMGNSLGDVKVYRELLDRCPTFQGGFVWDFIDQALMIDGALRYGGDMGDRPNDQDFCGNGIIFADRAIADRSAKAPALRYSYQPISFTVADGCITVKNHYLFRDTAHLAFRWELLRSGEIVLEQSFDLTVAPGATAPYAFAPALPDDGAEYLVRIYAVQRENEGCLRAGTTIAHEEALLRGAEAPAVPVLPAPKVVDGYFNVGVTAGNVSYLFAKVSCSFMAAGLISIKVGSEEFLTAEPRPTVFRPTTSNDIGCKFDFQSSLALSFSRNIRCDFENAHFGMENDCFTATYHYMMDPATREGAAVTYTVDGAGRLTVRAALDRLTNLASLPLFGMRFQLPQDKDHFRYFGRGPFDNYPDRKDGTLSGIYESSCAQEFVPYIYPQECGNHEDVRYIVVEGKSADLRFDGLGKRFSFKYLPNSDFEIDNATHIEELPNSGRNHLTICGFMRGVGGDDSWGSQVHEPFTLPTCRDYSFEFTIIPTEK